MKLTFGSPAGTKLNVRVHSISVGSLPMKMLDTLGCIEEGGSAFYTIIHAHVFDTKLKAGM